MKRSNIMVSKRNKYEEIESYLNNQLSEKELSSFNQKLIKDKQLDKEVQLHRELPLAILDYKVIALEEKLKKIQVNFNFTNNKQVVWQSPLLAFATVKRYILAACFCLTITGLFYLHQQQNKDNSPKSLYENYYQPYEIYTANKSLTKYNNPLQAAFQCYQTQDYPKALTGFVEAYQVDNTNQEAKLYAGICLLELNQIKEATLLFKQVIKEGKDNLKQVANWYLALSYLKVDIVDSTKIILHGLITDNANYRYEARSILRHIE